MVPRDRESQRGCDRFRQGSARVDRTRRAVWRTATSLPRFLDVCLLGSFSSSPDEGLPFGRTFAKVVPQTGQAAPPAINYTGQECFRESGNGLGVIVEQVPRPPCDSGGMRDGRLLCRHRCAVIVSGRLFHF